MMAHGAPYAGTSGTRRRRRSCADSSGLVAVWRAATRAMGLGAGPSGWTMWRASALSCRSVRASIRSGEATTATTTRMLALPATHPRHCCRPSRPPCHLHLRCLRFLPIWRRCRHRRHRRRRRRRRCRGPSALRMHQNLPSAIATRRWDGGPTEHAQALLHHARFLTSMERILSFAQAAHTRPTCTTEVRTAGCSPPIPTACTNAPAMLPEDRECLEAAKIVTHPRTRTQTLKPRGFAFLIQMACATAVILIARCVRLTAIGSATMTPLTLAKDTRLTQAPYWPTTATGT